VHTDVKWIEWPAGPHGGATYCEATLPNGRCDAYVAMFVPPAHVEMAFLVCAGSHSAWTAYSNNLNVTIRHELGHTVGLMHVPSDGTPCSGVHPAADDAMVIDWLGPNDYHNKWYTYSAHHRTHVNACC
jgi:hypothetical protein